MTFPKLQDITKPAFFIYPLLIIIIIPTLLVINTFWNLRTFDRDVNFLIRHQAISTADTIKPAITEAINDKKDLSHILQSAKKANNEIVSLYLMQIVQGKIRLAAKTDTNENIDQLSQDSLNQLALSLHESFAGLVYDPFVGQNVWSVVVPLSIDKDNSYILKVKLKTETVNTILIRTSHDSYLILAITILVSLLLLINHFIFYQKAARAQQLTELDQLKDEFISMASHELRTPVTALIGFLELLKSKMPADISADVQKDFTALTAIGHQLQSLINDLLEVSRIEQKRVTITWSEVDLNAIISEVVQTLTPLAAEKKLEIIFTPATLPKIQSDPERFRQIITNLINNSIKYTLQGKIEVGTVNEYRLLKITVKDTGIGIPPERMPQLFTKFYRVKDEKTSGVQGTGLGLWITKQLIELLGGAIFVESMYGSGSLFTFTLPVRKSTR